MQCVQIKDQDIRDIERKMFNFLWSNKNTSGRPIDRIKRSLLKNDIDDGGLTDDSNRYWMSRQSAKIKAVYCIRAAESNHNISTIKLRCLEKCGYEGVLINEWLPFINNQIKWFITKF